MPEVRCSKCRFGGPAGCQKDFLEVCAGLPHERLCEFGLWAPLYIDWSVKGFVVSMSWPTDSTDGEIRHYRPMLWPGRDIEQDKREAIEVAFSGYWLRRARPRYDLECIDKATGQPVEQVEKYNRMTHEVCQIAMDDEGASVFDVEAGELVRIHEVRELVIRPREVTDDACS